VLFEYYAGTEGAGMTLIDSAEWRAHPGSVGRPVSGDVHIVDEETGVEVGPNATGTVYFSGGAQFRYHNDAAKTAASYGPNGWNTLGDIGHRDEDGYVYLTDRKAFTVISGGVNIYPQQTENVLAGHPAVADVAAFGVPQEDLGEELVALVELADPAAAGNPTAAELVDWCRARLAHQSCPRRLEFRDHLPRAENGKLYKRQLRTDFLAGQNAASHAASRKDRTSDGSS
jgi:fatty-acyl-CoA synthase